MALYLGKKVLMLNLAGVPYVVNFKFGDPITILTADGYTLKDSNGVYLKTKWGD